MGCMAVAATMLSFYSFLLNAIHHLWHKKLSCQNQESALTIKFNQTSKYLKQISKFLLFENLGS